MPVFSSPEREEAMRRELENLNKGNRLQRKITIIAIIMGSIIGIANLIIRFF